MRWFELEAESRNGIITRRILCAVSSYDAISQFRRSYYAHEWVKVTVKDRLYYGRVPSMYESSDP